MEPAPGHILIVDDSAVVRGLLQGLLAQGGHEVTGARSADEAMVLLEDHAYDLVITDLRMPGTDGLTFARWLRTHMPDCDVVMMTGYASLEAAVHALRLGVIDFLVKPLIGQGPSVLGVVSKAMERRAVAKRLEVTTNALRDANRKLNELASRDPLTEVLNRRGFERMLHSCLGSVAGQAPPMAGVLIDLDDFGLVNRRFGHSAGDEVLRGVAQRLQTALRDGDHLARIGGDEFFALLYDCRLEEAYVVAERLRVAVSARPMELAADRVRQTLSLGVIALPRQPGGLDELIVLSQIALAASKNKGKNQVTGICKDRRPPLADALDGGLAFRALVHPIVQLIDGAPHGTELLVRGPAGPFERPVDLFAAAREGNLTTLVDLRCLEACVAAAQRVRGAQRLHLNVLPSTLLTTPSEQLLRVLGELAPRVCIEVSERELLGNLGSLRRMLEPLIAAGATVALDDVGFGRSSLESLLLLEPDLLKIDRVCIRGASQDRRRARALERLVKVARGLDVEIVAEGVEAHDDLALLLDLGVEFGQGFFWGQPGPVEDADPA